MISLEIPIRTDRSKDQNSITLVQPVWLMNLNLTLAMMKDLVGLFHLVTLKEIIDLFQLQLPDLR